MTDLQTNQTDIDNGKLPKGLAVAFILFCVLAIFGLLALVVSMATESSDILAEYEGDDYEYVEYITDSFEAKLYYNFEYEKVLVITTNISNFGSFFDSTSTTSVTGISNYLTDVVIDSVVINYDTYNVYFSANSQNASTYTTYDTYSNELQEFELDCEYGFILVIAEDIQVSFYNADGEMIY